MNDTVKFLDTCWKNLPREEMRGFEGKSWIYQVAEQSSKGINTIKSIVDFWDIFILEDFEIHTIIDETDRILTQQGNYQHDSSQIDLHTLGFYLPYVFSNDARWGIYLNEPAILNIAAKIYLTLDKSLNQLTFAQFLRVIFEFVLIHELEHHAVERYGAYCHAINSKMNYVTSMLNRHNATNSFLEVNEALATAREMDISMLKRRTAKHITLGGGTNLEFELNRILSVWEKVPLPWPYSNWVRYQNNLGDGFRDLVVSMNESIDSLPVMQVCDQEAFRLHQQVPVRFLHISYIVRKQLVDACFRIVRLDVKKVVKHINGLIRKNRIRGLELVTGKGHPKTIKRPGYRSVDIDDNKWDKVDYDIIKQIAFILDLDPSDYVLEVQSL